MLLIDFFAFNLPLALQALSAVLLSCKAQMSKVGAVRLEVHGATTTGMLTVAVASLCCSLYHQRCCLPASVVSPSCAENLPDVAVGASQECLLGLDSQLLSS